MPRVDVGLLERELELSALRSCLEGVDGGVGRVVVIEGEAGVGKTSLARAARAHACGRGMRVLGARGSELERDFPFGVVRQLFETVLVEAGAVDRAELLAGAAAPAGAIIGVESGDRLSGDSLGSSFAALHSLYWLASNLCESGATVLAIDDLHWADEASVRFVRFMLPRVEELALLLVVAFRASEPGSPAEELARIASDPAAVLLRPGPLSVGAVAEIVRGAISESADERVCLACHEVSGGNPFLVRELVAELRAQGAVGSPQDAARVLEVAPPALRRAVLLRLARLGDDARSLARAVAVLGDDVSLGIAAALAEVDVEAAGAAIDALVATGVLDGERPLRYRHPLLRTAVYADIPPMQAAHAHARAAALLSAAGAGPERVAAHLMRTEPRGDAAAAELLLAAARLALNRAAPVAAGRLIKRALAEPPPRELRGELVRLLVSAVSRGGERETVEAAGVDPVAELTASDDSLLASAWHLSMFLLDSGRAAEVPELLDRAVAVALGRGEVELALGLDGLLVAFGMVSPALARDRFARHAAAVEPGSAGERLWLALQAWWAMFVGERAEDAGELARRALADGRIFGEQGHSPVPGQAVLVLARTEQLELAAERVEVLAAHERASGTVGVLATVAYLRAYVCYLGGEVTVAAAEARSAVDVARQAAVIGAVPMFGAVWLDALIERDEPDQADQELAALGWNGAVPDGYWWISVLVSRARLHLAQRRYEQAEQDLLAAEAINEKHGISTPFYLLGSQLGLALSGQGREAEALRAAKSELERGRRWGAPSAVAGALRVIGLLSPRDESLERLSEAVTLLERSPIRLEYARALADLGGALRRANRRADAREPLRRALELARRGGAVAIAKRAYGELEATGEKLRPLFATGVESLTPSERRVAELAAEGLSNREIAQALFLTIKTVEGHLSHTYRKLDIDSRLQLPDALGAR